MAALWRHVFEIGAANRARLNRKPPGVLALLWRIAGYYRRSHIDAVSD